LSIQLSVTANAYLNEQALEPNIILQVKGIPFIFGAQAVFEPVRIGSFIIGDGTLIGGVSTSADSRDWIMLNGTTNNISQQINIDRAEGSSVTSFKISLIDKDGELTRVFSPGEIIADPLGVEATVYWMPAQASFPRDAAVLFVGLIDNIAFKQGSVILNVAHPDQLKRQDLLVKSTAKVIFPVEIDSDEILVDSALGFINPQDSLESYIRINDEIIKYQSSNETSFVTLERGQLGTIPAVHEADDDVESFYVLTGRPFDLALKILLSGGEDELIPAPRFNQIESGLFVQNSIFFETFSVQESQGLVPGDFVTIQDAANPANNITTEIISFGQSSLGSYVVVRDTLITEVDSTAQCIFKSKYNVLNFGCGLKPYQVDVEQFEKLRTLVGSSHPEISIYIKDTIKASDFLDKEIYFPFGIYSVPRKGRVSCNVTVPPIAEAGTVILDASNITNASALSVERTINQRFYNAIVYKYDIDSISDRFLSARIRQSASSSNRIKVGNKFLTIQSNGLRDSVSVQNSIDIQARRFLDRYQFGAEKIQVETTFAAGFKVEVGDTVILDGGSVGLSDSKNGSRDFAPRIMEVTNKSLNLKNGQVKLEITDTGYSTQARYGSWAPSSIVDAGSTGSNLKLKRSFSTGEFQSESAKWSDYVGQKIYVRTEDWTAFEETTIVEIIPNRPNEIRVNPPVSSFTEGLIIDVPPYKTAQARDGQLYKTLHCSWTRADEIQTTPSLTTFTTSSPELYRQSLEIRIRDEQYNFFEDFTVLSVDGNLVTIDRAPLVETFPGYLVDFVQFPDGGNYYAFF